MTEIVKWVSIGILLLFLIIGLGFGLIRGLKRSSLHLLFLVLSIILAFFITKPITKLILNSNITVNGEVVTISDAIINFISEQFDVSKIDSATEFLKNIPNAIVSPIMFIILSLGCFAVFDVIYMIVAKVWFGSKKKDFENKKPYRAYGGVIGLLEGFLFMFILFAPITSLTNVYEEIIKLPPTAESQMLENNSENSEKKKTVGETLLETIPTEVNEAILSYNKSVVGKISSAGGINNMLFDKLANFEVEGEEIVIREEIVSVTATYDDFVVIYNFAIDKNYISADFTSLKENLTKVLDNGIFKGVISNTIKEIIVKFDDLKEGSFLESLPQLVQDIVVELKNKFSEENFDAYEYLKSDILNVVDVVESVFKSNLVTKYDNLENKDFENILKLVEGNQENIKTIVSGVLNLNLVKDTFSILGDYASDKISEFLQNDEGLEIALNTNISDKEKMIDDMLKAIESFVDLNDKISISELLSSNDIIETLTSVEDIGEVLITVGKTFDKVRNLEILVLPETQERLEKVYVFDNILKLYDLELLGDEVYLTKDSTSKTELSTYELFFTYISNPIEVASQLGLTDIGKEGVTFDNILDRVLAGLSINEDLFTDIMLPFYQLEALNLKTIVFDKIIDQLAENVSLLDFADVKTENSYQTWKSEFNLIGKTLNILNSGNIQNKTYLKYLMQSDADLETLMKAMISDKKENTSVLSQMLNPVLSAKTFKTLTKQIFDEIDSSISDLTGSTISTFPQKSNLDVFESETVKTKTISTIEKLLDITLNNDLSSSNKNALSLYGKVLEILRVDAYNNGEKNGVFNEIFTHVIWYLTGDNISNDANKFNNLNPNENAKDIKKYIGITDVQDYYTYENFETIMIEIQEVIDFADTLSTALEGTSVSDTVTYAKKVKDVIDKMDETEEKKVEIINNMKKMLSVKNKSLLTDSEHEQYDNDLTTAINEVYKESSTDLRNALIELFTFNPKSK